MPVQVPLFRMILSFALVVIAGGVLQGPALAAPSLHYLYGSGSQTGGKQIQLRVELTEAAPSGGTTITLTSNDSAVPLPATVTVPAGETEHQFSVTTNPVSADRQVTVSATLNGTLRSRTVLIKAPVLTSIGLQTVIRHGGQGKVIVRLSGPAPAGGLDVTAVVDPHVLSLPGTISIPEGVQSLSLKPNADIFGTTAVPPDQPFTLTVSEGPRSFSKSAVIRVFITEPDPTATATAPATATATATTPATATATATTPATASATATNTAFPTMTNTPTSTATSIVQPTSTNTAEPTATNSPEPTSTSTPDNGFSEACNALNNPSYDGVYQYGSIAGLMFEPGDRIVWVFGGVDTGVVITVSGIYEIFSGPVPGQYIHDLNSDGTYFFEWETTGGEIPWDVSCTSDNPLP